MNLKSYMAELQFHRALESVWSALDHANRYIVQTAPFTMIKDPAKASSRRRSVASFARSGANSVAFACAVHAGYGARVERACWR